MKPKYFDCHFHIIDKTFPLVSNQGFMPEAFTSADYLDRLREGEKRGREPFLVLADDVVFSLKSN